ncbi:hypothetical protein OUN72_002746 [Salmonella enterica subsp. enterica serovar Essen]|uniref:hypothetical protein n=1 Tax=Salmonella enterica TaxID=28901 RepID=UPI0009738009|nr:hypothetical protein [Salmonella enterica]ECZ5234341.1 hypothetical protein [Salmonella enterica subsp. enterica serovar Enteritidis]EDR1223959.1 hypothetical protein [Salmonella enterica subsp. enterica serovar Gateshead]EEI9692733.1 hypothetical protein [Salmonella enterica subsp. enterica serovar Hillingdon]APY59757.1 hypothetical protein LFZ14_11195 [Salmonella enterica subsp. enterica serovar Hillingdon str. N1529-D3]EAP0905275.1 hypothetical protein [Salmonella enterica]
MPRPVGNKEYVIIDMSFMQDETVQKAVNVNNRYFQMINSADLPLIGHSSSTSTLNDLLDRAENRSLQSFSSEYRDASSRSSSTLTLNDTLDSAKNRLFQPVNSDGLGLITRNSSTLTLNNLLDSAAGNELTVHHRQMGSQFSLNDLLDAMGTEAAVSETAANQYGDCIIKIPHDRTPAVNDEVKYIEARNTCVTIPEEMLSLRTEVATNDVCLELDAKILKILTCRYQYQLDAIVGDIMPAESDNAEKVRQIMRMYAEQYRLVYEKSGCFYKAYMSLHKCVENLLPYSFRAGGNISFHLLIQALFFDGKYDNAELKRESITPEPTAPITMKPDAFFNSVLSLNLSQVKLFGDIISALLFHFPSIFYQYPKLRDEINQCIEKRTVTGSVVARLTLCLASTLLAIAPLVMLSGAMQAGTILRHVGRGISYIDIPIVLTVLGESWYQAYKYGSSGNEKAAQKFIAQEATFKTTQRVLSQGLSLFSSLSGSIMRSIGKGTAPEMMLMFIINTLNLFLHQNPYEGTSVGAKALKRAAYLAGNEAITVQTIALLVDLKSTGAITQRLFNCSDRFVYMINLRRTRPKDQVHILKEVISACSRGHRAILQETDKQRCLTAIDHIYNGDFTLALLEGLPEEFTVFLTYLNTLRKRDASCLSLGNEVNEKIIAALIKVLSFRETVLLENT